MRVEDGRFARGRMVEEGGWRVEDRGGLDKGGGKRRAGREERIDRRGEGRREMNG